MPAAAAPVSLHTEHTAAVAALPRRPRQSSPEEERFEEVGVAKTRTSSPSSNEPNKSNGSQQPVLPGFERFAFGRPASWRVPMDRRPDCERRLALLLKDAYWMEILGDGDCHAGNKHFANTYGLHPSTVRDLYRELEVVYGLAKRTIRSGWKRTIQTVVPLEQLALAWPLFRQYCIAAKLLPKNFGPKRRRIPAAPAVSAASFSPKSPRQLRAKVRASSDDTIKVSEERKRESKHKSAVYSREMSEAERRVVASLHAQGVSEAASEKLVRTIGVQSMSTVVRLLAWRSNQGKSYRESVTAYAVDFAQRWKAGTYELPAAFCKAIGLISGNSATDRAADLAKRAGARVVSAEDAAAPASAPAQPEPAPAVDRASDTGAGSLGNAAERPADPATAAQEAPATAPAAPPQSSPQSRPLPSPPASAPEPPRPRQATAEPQQDPLSLLPEETRAQVLQQALEEVRSSCAPFQRSLIEKKGVNAFPVEKRAKEIAAALLTGLAGETP